MKRGQIFLCGLVVSLFASACTLASGQSFRASPSMGAVVQGSDYDPVKGVTTVHIVNTSGKVITFLHMSYIVTLPDGAESLPGQHQMGLELLSYLITVKLLGHPVEGMGDGGIQPGATFNYEFIRSARTSSGDCGFGRL
jgi:hypothetical protein